MVVWNSEKSLLLTKSVRGRFKECKELSNRSISHIERENDIDKFISRIKDQIIQVNESKLPYDTPEKWDSSFYKLGGGPSRRKSSSILSRMSWNKFLEKFEEIIQNNT